MLNITMPNKTIGTHIMIIFYIELMLFALFIGNVCRLFIHLIIKTK